MSGISFLIKKGIGEMMRACGKMLRKTPGSPGIKQPLQSVHILVRLGPSLA
jgi:hypothetical protein